jgi:hypothetical protein
MYSARSAFSNSAQVACWVLDLHDALTDPWFYHTLEARNLLQIVDVPLLHLILIGSKKIRDVLVTESSSYLHHSIDSFVN